MVLSEYSCESIAAVNKQKIGDGPVLPIIAPAIGVQRLPDITTKANVEVRYGYRW